MPPLNAAPEDERNLIAFLSRLGGLPAGSLAGHGETVSREDMDSILRPKPGEWPTYNGNVNGNRHSRSNQINRQNVTNLAVQWVYSVPYFGLETTPLVADGVMYVTGPNQVYALDAAQRAGDLALLAAALDRAHIAADAAKGVNRGVAMLGDRVFYTTDNAHLICLDRLTGALRWDVYMPEAPQHYGATAAPLVVNDLVIAGVAGADEGIRGFLAAYKATTGELAWRFWTVPRRANPAATPGRASRGVRRRLHLAHRHLRSRSRICSTGPPAIPSRYRRRRAQGRQPVHQLRRGARPATPASCDGITSSRPTTCTTGTPRNPPCWWTPQFQGRPRKLLLHADRNGFFYVLDRTNGELLLAKPFARKISWASGIDAKGRPIELPGNVPTPEGTRHLPRHSRRSQLDVHGVQSGHRSVLRNDHRKLRHLPKHAVRSESPAAGCECPRRRAAAICSACPAAIRPPLPASHRDGNRQGSLGDRTESPHAQLRWSAFHRRRHCVL